MSLISLCTFFSLFAKIIFSNNVLVRGDEHSYLIGQLTNKNPVNSKTIPCLPKSIVWSIDSIQYSLYTRSTFLAIFLLCAFFADFSCLFFVSIFWRKNLNTFGLLLLSCEIWKLFEYRFKMFFGFYCLSFYNCIKKLEKMTNFDMHIVMFF